MCCPHRAALAARRAWGFAVVACALAPGWPRASALHAGERDHSCAAQATCNNTVVGIHVP